VAPKIKSILDNNRKCLKSLQQQSHDSGAGDLTYVELLNLRYDLTHQRFINMIVTEIGIIPPHSVPVVIREMRNESDDEEDGWLMG